MTDEEKKFREKNGMSLEEAVDTVKKWFSEGKIKEAEQGRDEILSLFPDHDIQRLFSTTEDPDVQMEDIFSLPDTEEKQDNLSVSPDEGISEVLKEENSEIHQQNNKKEESKNNFFKTAATFIQEKSEKIKEMSSSGETNIQRKPADENEKLLGASCYAWFFVLIPFFLRPDSAFVRFHAFQGIVLTIIFTFIDFFIFGILNIAFGNLYFFQFIVKMFLIATYAMGGYAAYHGQWLKIPIIFGLSEKLQAALVKH